MFDCTTAEEFKPWYDEEFNPKRAKGNFIELAILFGKNYEQPDANIQALLYESKNKLFQLHRIHLLSQDDPPLWDENRASVPDSSVMEAEKSLHESIAAFQSVLRYYELNRVGFPEIGAKGLMHYLLILLIMARDQETRKSLVVQSAPLVQFLEVNDRKWMNYMLNIWETLTSEPDATLTQIEVSEE